MLVKLELSAGTTDRYEVTAWLYHAGEFRQLTEIEPKRTKEELQADFNTLLRDAQERLRGTGGLSEAMGVEVFLQVESLGLQVEQWNVTVGRSTLKPVGTRRSIVVRSHDRVYDPDLRAGGTWDRWAEKWKARQVKLPDDQLYCVNSKDDLCGDLFDKLEKKLAFLAVCPLAFNRESVDPILDAATPVALWVRGRDGRRCAVAKTAVLRFMR